MSYQNVVINIFPAQHPCTFTTMSHPRVGKKEYNTSSTNDLFQALPGEERGNILKTLKLCVSCFYFVCETSAVRSGGSSGIGSSKLFCFCAVIWHCINGLQSWTRNTEVDISMCAFKLFQHQRHILSYRGGHQLNQCIKNLKTHTAHPEL